MLQMCPVHILSQYTSQNIKSVQLHKLRDTLIHSSAERKAADGYSTAKTVVPLLWPWLPTGGRPITPVNF